MDGKSLTPQEVKLQQLKEILPEAFAEGKVDWEKLKATNLINQNSELKKLIRDANELVSIFVATSKTIKKRLNLKS